MIIVRAEEKDLQAILDLQHLAYRTEAALLDNYEIPPLKQTLAEKIEEYRDGVILKAVSESGTIIGSVRAYKKGDTAFIGKLMVTPTQQKKGIGSALLQRIEAVCQSERYELFTSEKSESNLRLYEKNGYKRFKQEDLAPKFPCIFLEKYSK